MNDSQLEAQLGHWLSEGPRTAPARLAGSAATYALEHPRHRSGGWRALMAGAGVLVRPTPIALRPLVLLVLLALTFALGAAFYAAWHNSAVVPHGYVCPSDSNPDETGPAGQQLPWTGTRLDRGWGPLFFDATSHQIFAIDRNPMSVWAFDVCHNTWAPTAIALDGIEAPQIMFLADGGATLVIDEFPNKAALPGDHRLAAYGLTTGTRRELGLVPFGRNGDVAYRVQPGERVSGQVVVLWEGQLWAYDPAAGLWQQLAALGDLPPAYGLSEMGYDPSADRLILYTRFDYWTTPQHPDQWGPRVYEFDFASSTWTRAPDPVIDIPISWSGKSHHFAIDEVARQVVAYFGDANAVRYDSTRHQFDVLDIAPAPSPYLGRFQPAVVYDSINRRLVVISWLDDTFDMVALDINRGQWIDLNSQ